MTNLEAVNRQRREADKPSGSAPPPQTAIWVFRSMDIRHDLQLYCVPIKDFKNLSSR